VIKNAFKVSEVLDRFPPERPKTNKPCDNRLLLVEPINDKEHFISDGIDRVNNLPNLSPPVFEVLLKNSSFI
jgi:hypothetical protein